MKTFLIAGFLFVVPSIGVIAMNPQAVKQSVENADKWVKETFPEQKPKKKRQRRRG